ECFEMVRHAQRTHCPNSAVFPVSSLGGPAGTRQNTIDREDPHSQPPVCPLPTAHCLLPSGLPAPFAGFAEALRVEDATRLQQLGELAPNDIALRDQCVACFAHRYPETEAAAAFQEQLRSVRWRQRRRRSLLGAAAAACLVVGLTAYDVVGYEQ